MFNGGALLALVRAKYNRSYDFSLVQRQYMGKHFVALNMCAAPSALSFRGGSEAHPPCLAGIKLCS